MHEADKIRQAQHHRQQMAKVDRDPESFRYEFSAFVAAARSVLQFAHREAKGKPDGQDWYKSVMAGSALLQFFREKRNLDIHEEPVTIAKDIEVHIEERLGASDAWELELRGPDARVKQHFKSPSVAERAAPEAQSPRVVYCYRFRDWSGPEEVQILCDNLIDELKAVVADGQRRGLLTP